MCLVFSCISMSILAPCLTNQVGLGVPRKRSGQVLGEEADRRCCGRLLLKGIAKMYRHDDLTKGRENNIGKKGEEKGKIQESSYSYMACFEGLKVYVVQLLQGHYILKLSGNNQQTTNIEIST